MTKITKCECGNNKFYIKKRYKILSSGNFVELESTTEKEKMICSNCDKELKTTTQTIVVCKTESAVFCGSCYLKKVILETEAIESNKGRSDYSLEDLQEIKLENCKEKEELDLLIKELEENDFDYLTIEH